MERLVVSVPDNVDREEAQRAVAGIIATLAAGQRFAVIILPGDVPNERMPAVVSAAMLAAKVEIARGLVDAIDPQEARA